jgi:hypothetical protein
MELREFKTKYLALLFKIGRELLSKYPERRERIEYIVDTIVNKLYHLRTFTLPDYLHTLYIAVKEFREFEELIPESEEIEKLLDDQEVEEQ